ncbi:MAG TPA: hypothetical protein VLB68_26475 [Pyrinomonadaceae bacterium]|nr:hypothetical protein [Pyrinomonadaceae bacterium]
MKPQLLNDPIRNPFYNRFNDPVQRRLDDIQSHEYTVWLRDRNRAMSIPSPAISRDGAQPHHSRLFAGILVLSVLVAISAAVVSFALR